MRVSRLNTNRFEVLNRGILEYSGRIRSLQDELQTIVNELARTQEDYQKGKIPRDSFRNNTRKFSKDRRRLEREINNEVRGAVGVITQAKKLVRLQRV